jgi:hypothetical protein
MNKAARITLVVTGAVAALFAGLLLALGGLALYGDSQKDDHGYLTTDAQQFEAGTRALTTENLDIDLDGAEALMDEDDFGEVRLAVEARTDKPVFVGIARTDDVTDYLSGVSRTEITDVNTGPFDVDSIDYGSDDRAGGERPTPPARSNIWVASAHGSGPQTLDWDIEDGDWSVVVMNADGSRGVDTDISAGAKVPYLEELGWTLFGTGAFTLAFGIALIALGARRPNRPSGTAPAGGAIPAAA